MVASNELRNARDVQKVEESLPGSMTGGHWLLRFGGEPPPHLARKVNCSFRGWGPRSPFCSAALAVSTRLHMACGCGAAPGLVGLPGTMSRAPASFAASLPVSQTEVPPSPGLPAESLFVTSQAFQVIMPGLSGRRGGSHTLSEEMA